VKSRPQSNWDGSIRGRIGWLITPQSLLYATGGFAFGNFTTPYHEADRGDTVELLGGSRTGWTVGGGLEYALDRDWNTRIEYRYTDWGTRDVVWDDHAATSKLKDSRVIAGLTYKLAGLGVAPAANFVAVNWTGFYVGGQVGASAAYSQFGPNQFDPQPEYSDFTQLLAGGHAGYNYQYNRLVVGIEGDLNKKLGHGFKIDDQLRPTSSWDGSIRGRIGVLATPQALLYFTGGYAWGHFTTPLSNADAGDLDGEHLGGDRHGWTWGGGIQYAIDQNLSMRIEYRHTNWGEKWTNEAFDFNPASLRDDRVAVGMSYKLGDWVVAAKY
jgi:outer membrane immunogenic protein